MDQFSHHDTLRRLTRTDPDPRVRHRAGRPRKLAAAAREVLATAPAASPLDDDYPGTTWTVADLTDVLGRHGWHVHPVTVYRVLHEMGYQYRRPRHDLTHRQDAGAGFRRVYVDACDLHTHPHLAHVWQRRGHPVIVPAAGKDQRRAIFGALDYGSGEVIWQMHRRKGGDLFAAFLDRIAQRWPDEQLVLVMDNVSYHRSPMVRAWWADQEGRVTPFWLPVSTPTLTLIERVWRFLKQKLVCHRFWADVTGLQAAATTLLNQLEAHFHAAASPGIHLVNNFCETA